jgi:hypothetical protein
LLKEINAMKAMETPKYWKLFAKVPEDPENEPEGTGSSPV